MLSHRETEKHPRPDLLGRLGKLGKGDAPVLLSTELQRSTREKADAELVESLSKTIEKYATNQNNQTVQTLKEKILADLNVLGGTNVLVNGNIYLKTDGETRLTSFRKENSKETSKDKWFSFKYVRNKDGRLEAES